MKARPSNLTRVAGTALATAAMTIGPVWGGESGARILRKQVVVQAPVEKVWNAWTTEEGLRFISSASRVELRVGGPYEWFLDLEPDDNGKRGGEGARVLAFLPEEVLAFTWTFPPSIPSLRNSGRTTQAVVLFDEPTEGSTRVRFAQHGWGEGEDWDAGFAYFDRAWSVVLDRLKQGLETTTSSAPGNR